MTTPSPERTARRIALYLYVPLATAWILGTDILLAVSGGGVDGQALLNMAKGAGFALVTGALLYLLIKRELVAREKRERDHRTLTENVPDLVFRLRVRPDLIFEYVSPSSVDIAGYAPEEYYADPEAILRTVHEEDQPRLQALLTDMDSETEAAELRWHHKDGHVFWGEIRARKERGPDGHVVRLSGVLRDVTQQRASERLRALLSSALEATGEAVLITDPTGKIEYVNRAFTEITGYLPEDAIGRTPRLLRSGETEEAVYDKLWQTITSGRTFRGVLVNRRADGRHYDQATSITPVRDELGEIRHYIAVARDITVQRALERRLRFTEKMDAVGQLAAGVAHDFRNLLNVILVNAEFLDAEWGTSGGGADAGRGRAEIDEILIAARRGADLVGRLLRVARQPEMKLQSIDLGRLARDMHGMLRAMLRESVELDVRVGEGSLMASVDPDLLRDALLNLVANAGQAMPRGGRVVVELASDEEDTPGDGRTLRISVRDDGIGMDQETLARVFDPFFTTKEHGTGLGLPMVKGIVENHGGALEVRSVLGEGTTVTMRLPRAADSHVAEDGGEVLRAVWDAPGAQRTGEHLLLVEDDDRLRSACERALRRLGYQVTTAADGAEGLNHLERAPTSWDLVISDLVMPGIGGLELYERVQQQGLSIPFLFMSGHGPEAVSQAGVSGSAHTFLEKPWTLETLRVRVREAMDQERRSA